MKVLRRVGAVVTAGSAIFGLSTYVISAGVADATPSSGAPTSSCTYTDSGTGNSGTAAVAVTPGSTLTISCTGMPASTAVAVAETSPLAAYANGNLTDSESVTDLSTADLTGMTDASGSLSATLSIPSTFAATNGDATCPPTQAEINAGLVDCEVAIAALTQSPLNTVQLVYAGQASPANPTVTLNQTSGVAGDSLSVSGSGWWGAAIFGAPDATMGVSLTASVGGVSTSATGLSVSPASYTFNSGATGGTLTAPALSGTITVPPGGSTGGVAIQETNLTTATGTGAADAATGTNNVEGAAAFTYEGTPSASAAAASAGPGTSVAISGTGWDPQGGTVAVSFASGSPASTGTASVSSAGALSGSIPVTSADTQGSNDITVTQTSAAGTTLTATVAFTVNSLAAGPAGTVNQIISETVTGNPNGLTLTDPGSSPAVPTDVLTATTLDGYGQTATGTLGEVTVIDARGTLAGWTVTGQLEHDFSGGTAGTNPDDYEIPASDLGVTPAIAGAPNGGLTSEVTAPGTEAFNAAASNLGDASAHGITLASAAKGGGGGAFLLNGSLSLTVPAYVSQGTYSAIVDLVVG